MNTTSGAETTNVKTTLMLLLLAVLFIVALNFIAGELKYYSLDPDVLGRFWSFKWVLIGHVTGGVLALIIGPVQFWPTLRNRYLSVHRWLGRTYLVAILIGSICASILSWTSAVAVHWTWALSLQVMAIVWITSAFMAYRAIRKLRIQSHKEWMIRSYVITFAFVSFRWLVDLPIIADLGNFIERAPTVAWVSWVIPLFITEVILQWNKK